MHGMLNLFCTGCLCCHSGTLSRFPGLFHADQWLPLPLPRGGRSRSGALDPTELFVRRRFDKWHANRRAHTAGIPGGRSSHRASNPNGFARRFRREHQRQRLDAVRTRSSQPAHFGRFVIIKYGLGRCLALAVPLICTKLLFGLLPLPAIPPPRSLPAMTERFSLDMALIENNASVGSAIAVELSNLRHSSTT